MSCAMMCLRQFIGIGVDDMFVIVSSWQSSKPPKAQSNSRFSFIARYTAKSLGAVVSLVSLLLANIISYLLCCRVSQLQ